MYIHEVTQFSTNVFRIGVGAEMFVCLFVCSRSLPVGPDQLLLRGAMLRNTRWIFGEWGLVFRPACVVKVGLVK